MLSALAKPRSSKAKGWMLVLLTLIVILLLAAFFDLPSQFRLRNATHDLAGGAVHKLFQPRSPSPQPYRVEPARKSN